MRACDNALKIVRIALKYCGRNSKAERLLKGLARLSVPEAALLQLRQTQGNVCELRRLCGALETLRVELVTRGSVDCARKCDFFAVIGGEVLFVSGQSYQPFGDWFKGFLVAIETTDGVEQYPLRIVTTTSIENATLTGGGRVPVRVTSRGQRAQ